MSDHDFPLAELDQQDIRFPAPEKALKEPNGMLAWGGDLRPERLLEAYRNGIFPWYETGQPLLWWSPDPRAILDVHGLKVSRSMRRTLRRKPFRVTLNNSFREVIKSCAYNSKRDQGTWITPEMQRAYAQMHEHGHAHSVECWHPDGTLAGGLYGVAVGRIFCGESMFSEESDASKVALYYLCNELRHAGAPFIDCQLGNPHLHRLGIEMIPRAEFLEQLHAQRDQSLGSAMWRPRELFADPP